MRTAVALAIMAGMGSAAMGQQYVMMPDSTNNRVVLFSPVDGSVQNSSYFGLAAGTPIHAMQVENEIWVSEQLGDRVSRWSLTGTSLGAIVGGMDNVRGMGRVGNTIYVCSTGTTGGAPGRAIFRYDTTGAPLGFVSTPLSSGFHVFPHNGGILVSSDAANDDIHRYDLSVVSLGVFHNSTSLNFAEQMDYATNGDVLVAVFSSNVVARLDPVSGAIISTFPASGARGVFQLSNGNIMWTNSAGAHVYNVVSGTSTNVYATTGGRFLDTLDLTEPCCIDYNGDEEIDFSDIEGFIAALAAQVPGNCAPGADLNNDEEFDFSDVETFIALYNAGCTF